MLVMACLRHWYMSFIFFGPVPIVGFWLWLSSKRHPHDGGDDIDGGDPASA